MVVRAGFRKSADPSATSGDGRTERPPRIEGPCGRSYEPSFRDEVVTCNMHIVCICS
jgi:hypothetical protein